LKRCLNISLEPHARSTCSTSTCVTTLLVQKYRLEELLEEVPKAEVYLLYLLYYWFSCFTCFTT
jgi:hypothetical protein